MTSFSSGFDYRLFACRSAYPQRGGNIARAHGSCYLYESTIDYFWIGSGTPVWSGQVLCMGWVKIAYAPFALVACSVYRFVKLTTTWKDLVWQFVIQRRVGEKSFFFHGHTFTLTRKMPPFQESSRARLSVNGNEHTQTPAYSIRRVFPQLECYLCPFCSCATIYHPYS